MDEKTLYQILDNIGERHMPDTLDILPNIQTHMKKTRKLPVFLYRHPIRLFTSLVACFVLVATTVYAVTQLRTNDPGLQPRMVTELNMSQTIDDMTVTLDWAYADANRIVVAYSFSADQGRIPDDWVIAQVSLSDSAGRRYDRTVGAFGFERILPTMSSPNTHGSNQVFPEIMKINAHFDAIIIDDEPQELNLRLRILRNFAFDFMVPFNPGIRIDKQPDVEVAGLKANLEWAIITPSMTRIYVCYETPEGSMWFPGLRLSFDGQRIAHEGGASYPDFDGIQRDENGRLCRGNIFLTTYEELPQEITLAITHLQTPTWYSEENMRRAAEVFAQYGIEAEVLRNEAQTRESYLLNFPNLPDDVDLMEEAWEDAMANMGEPLEGESIDGPWVFTIQIHQ